MTKRVFIIVLDSFGIGAAPDAADFGDAGADTLASVAGSPGFSVPVMRSLGLFHIDGVKLPGKDNPVGSYGRMRERSMGKDTVIGHWEIAGIVSENPMPVFPGGFPKELTDAFSEKIGRGILCNRPYSGTDVIRDFGEEHMQTGSLIVYTSADSVFQIAAHEEVVPIGRQYEICETARAMLTGRYAVGRVIARPFTGTDRTNFQRTANRHDFSLHPPGDTLLTLLQKSGRDTIAVGKIFDIFAGEGISERIASKSNREGMERARELLRRDFCGLAFINLVDFDMLYGHRNDPEGYAGALSQFDRQLRRFMEGMRRDDLLIITADHGCDPGFPGTDHTRETVPLLVFGEGVRRGVNLGTRASFADTAAAVLECFGLPNGTDGESFWPLIQR